MPPAFPEFKKITPEDRAAVEAHTHRFDPYSDFNFTSLWAWDTGSKRMISDLNGNLVVRLTDYATEEPFLSFLGIQQTEQTARTLLDYCAQNALPAALKLVPEISTAGIRPSVLSVSEDRDNFDYIYSVSEHARFAGGEYKRSRNFVNTFVREYPLARIERLDLADAAAQSDLTAVLRAWEERKIESGKTYDLVHEEIAIKRLFQTALSHQLMVTAVFEGDMLCAFSIDELLPNQYAITHFRKADTAYKGIYDFLAQEKAKHFETLGIALLNAEQDLGVEGLRRSKEAYRPVQFLKKYSISYSVQ
jgi:hypothetical protein